jgi:hypothetical protein
MQYVILVYENEEAFAARSNERAGAYWGAYQAYSTAMREAGILRGGNGLQGPPAATSVRLKDGERLVQDGPFADAKEQLGGYVVIEVDNLDAALEWAARCPSMTEGGVEVRPVLVM